MAKSTARRTGESSGTKISGETGPETPRKLRIGEEVEVEIERLLPGGMGLAHARGRTLLVALAAPGDRARVRIRNMRGAVAFASIEEVIAASPVRVAPPCPYFGRCGGCDFQQLTYDAQLEAKVEIIRDCLRRVARIDYPSAIPITPSPAIWHYRSRAEWQYDSRRNHLGYFERGSHRVCDVAECPVVTPPLQATLQHLRRRMPEGGGGDAIIEFRAVTGDGGVTLAPPVDARGDGGDAVREIAGEQYYFNADCFFQINHAVLAPLIAEALGDQRGAMAVDLYCGVGLFTLPLARRFTQVIGIEGNEVACGYARRNLANANLSNAVVEVRGVGVWLSAQAGRLAPIDLVLLDPPRSGVEPGAVENILKIAPRRITYVSCDPATLARDLKILTLGGYGLDRVAAFDMFPQTHHVETIVHLSLAAPEITITGEERGMNRNKAALILAGHAPDGP